MKTSPQVESIVYNDANLNKLVDKNDQLILNFDQELQGNASEILGFSLPVTEDTFGLNPVLQRIDGTSQLNIILGSNPNIRSRGTYSSLSNVTGSASGLYIDPEISQLKLTTEFSNVINFSEVSLDIIPGFTLSPTIFDQNQTGQASTLCDLDNNGYLDLIVAHKKQPNKIYWNSTQGFTMSSELGGINNTQNVVAGDLNNDGWMDIIFVNIDEPGQIHFNQGVDESNIKFIAQIIPGQKSFNSRDVAIGDFNNDGWQDFIVINNSQKSEIYINQKNNNFSIHAINDTHQSLAVELGDLNNDGSLDVAIANHDQPNIIYLNDGTGVFSNDIGISISDESNSSRDLAIKDVDLDGYLDILIANYAQKNRLFINNGDGYFTLSNVSFNKKYNTRSVKMHDFDQDGDIDVFFANDQQENLVYVNNGYNDYTQSFPISSSSNQTYDIEVGDLNRDGAIDIAVINHQQPDAVYFGSIVANPVTLNFAESEQILGAGDSTEAVLADIDNDADLDILIANFSGEFEVVNTIFLNDGTGQFSPSPHLLVRDKTNSMALGDIDNDGDLDLVMANGGPDGNFNPNRVFINNINNTDSGKGVFSDSGQSLGTYNSFDVELGDFDNDGDLDIVIANNYSEIADYRDRIYFNDGNGYFDKQVARTFGTLSSSWSVDIGDINADGVLDLLTSSQNFRGNRVYPRVNDQFQLIGKGYGDGQNRSSAFADFNQDGYLDFVVAVYNPDGGEPPRVYLNNRDVTTMGYNLDLMSSNTNLPDFGERSVVIQEQVTGRYLVRIFDHENEYTDYSDLSEEIGSIIQEKLSNTSSLSDQEIIQKIISNLGHITFIEKPFWDTSTVVKKGLASHSLAVGDIDLDGDLDVVLGNHAQRIEFYLNDGEGGFSDAGIYFGDRETLDSPFVALGDLDNDGDLDLVVANRRNKTNKIYLNLIQ